MFENKVIDFEAYSNEVFMENEMHQQNEEHNFSFRQNRIPRVSKKKKILKFLKFKLHRDV